MAEYTVSNATELASKIKSAKSGDVINLNPGNYGALVIKDESFTADVTIRSASTSQKAHLDSIMVGSSDHLKFQGLDIGGKTTVANSAFKVFVTGSSYVTFDSVSIHGTLDNNPQNDSSGIRFMTSRFVTLRNSELQQLTRAVYFDRTSDITASGNKIHDIRMDGMALAEVQRVTIDSNVFTNFKRLVSDHSDAIQFWTTNTKKASTDIKITNNQILQGSGTAMQGIFMGNEINIAYQRVTIENNLIYESGYANGITVDGAKSVTVKGNTVISSPKIAGSTKIRFSNVNTATVANNLTDEFYYLGRNTAITKTNNIALLYSPEKVSQLKDIYAGSLAKAVNLTIAGFGYQIPGTIAESVVGSSSSSSASNGIKEPVVTTPSTTFNGMLAEGTTADAQSMSFAPATLSDTIAANESTTPVHAFLPGSDLATSSALSSALNTKLPSSFTQFHAAS